MLLTVAVASNAVTDSNNALGHQPDSGPLARAFAAGTLALAGTGAALASGGGSATTAVVGAGAAALVPYAEQLAALIGAEIRGKPPLLAAGMLAGARGVDRAITENRLAEVLIEDDRLRALTFRVLEAARRTARIDKLRWLGEVLGRVAVDGDRLDEGQIVIDAIDALEGPQIAVLRALASTPPAHESDPARWDARAIAAVVPLDSALVQACFGTLSRHGLAVNMGRPEGIFGGERGWALTSFGRTVLDVVKASADVAPAKSPSD